MTIAAKQLPPAFGGAVVFEQAPERVVQCVEFQGDLIVATETRVYRLVGDKLVLIPFVTVPADGSERIGQIMNIARQIREAAYRQGKGDSVTTFEDLFQSLHDALTRITEPAEGAAK